MNKYLIIVGAADNVMTDVVGITYMLMKLKVNFDYMCIGIDAIDKINCDIKYVATYHPKDIDGIRYKREKIKGNVDYKLICHEKPKRHEVSIVIPIDKLNKEKSGSSALLGVYAAQQEGYNKIILCGCPLEGKSITTKYPYENFRKGWIESKKLDKSKVRSMSGWTKVFLGEPEENWLLN